VAPNLCGNVSSTSYNVDNEQTKFSAETLSGACPECCQRDANGNLSGDGTNSYTWDARNQLTAISGANSASFGYDALGRRVSKTVNGTVTQYLYDGLNPVQLLKGASPPAVTANLLEGVNLDEYFRTSKGGGLSFLSDALGSTLGLVNSSGGVTASYSYAPFGKTTIAGTSSTSFQFTGRENDTTGLY
jgi:YD repeat-containing protein